jgi:hypothetical protein
VVPGEAGGGTYRIPASSNGGVGRGACREGLGFARDLFGPEFGGRDGRWRSARRRPTAASAAANALARCEAGWCGYRWWLLGWVLMKALSVSVGGGATGRTGSSAVATVADGGELGAGVRFRPGREHLPLYRRSGLAMRAHSY